MLFAKNMHKTCKLPFKYYLSAEHEQSISKPKYNSRSSLGCRSTGYRTSSVSQSITHDTHTKELRRHAPNQRWLFSESLNTLHKPQSKPSLVKGGSLSTGEGEKWEDCIIGMVYFGILNCGSIVMLMGPCMWKGRRVNQTSSNVDEIYYRVKSKTCWLDWRSLDWKQHVWINQKRRFCILLYYIFVITANAIWRQVKRLIVELEKEL